MITIKSEKISKLKDAWNSLYLNNKNASPFQDYEFALILKSAYKYYPYFVEKPIFYTFYEDGKIIMIAPLCKNRASKNIYYTSFGAMFRVAYEDFIYDDSMTEEKLSLLVNLLNEKLKKRIIFNFVSEESLLYKVFEDEYTEYKKEICMGFELPDNFDNYIKSLHGSSRKNYKHDCKLLNETDWEIKFFHEEKANKKEYKKILDVYVNRYDNKWTHETNFLKRKYNDWFIKYKHHNAIAMNKIKTGFIAVLYINGEIAAISGGYVQKNNNYIVLHRGAINDKFLKYSPGKILEYKLIKKSIEDYKIKYYDLSKGAEEYKNYFNSIAYYQHCYYVSEFDKRKEKRVLTVGVFDYFHFGHLRLFYNCKKYGEKLIVAVQDTDYIKKTKPNADIFYTLEQRIEMIESLKIVDKVIVYKNVDELLPTVPFDVFAVGGDQNHEGFKCAIKWCEDNNKEVVRLNRTPNVSSSSIKKQIEND